MVGWPDCEASRESDYNCLHVCRHVGKMIDGAKQNGNKLINQFTLSFHLQVEMFYICPVLYRTNCAEQVTLTEYQYILVPGNLFAGGINAIRFRESKLQSGAVG